MPCTGGSTDRLEYGPALCTHRPSLLPMDYSMSLRDSSRYGKLRRMAWSRGKRSRNKASVGEPADGSFRYDFTFFYSFYIILSLFLYLLLLYLEVTLWNNMWFSVCVCMCVYVCMHVCTCVCVYKLACAYRCMYVCVYVCMYIQACMALNNSFSFSYFSLFI